MGRRPGPSLTRAQILDAALELVAQEGPEALGMRALGKAMGIRAGSLYHHFAGQEALTLALALEGWSRLIAALPPPRKDLEQTLRGAARAYRAFALAHPGLYRVMVTTPFPPDEPGPMAVAEQALAGLGLPGLDHRSLRGLRAAVHGHVHLELMGQLGPGADEAFDWALETFLLGLAANRRLSAAGTSR